MVGADVLTGANLIRQHAQRGVRRRARQLDTPHGAEMTFELPLGRTPWSVSLSVREFSFAEGDLVQTIDGFENGWRFCQNGRTLSLRNWTFHARDWQFTSKGRQFAAKGRRSRPSESGFACQVCRFTRKVCEFRLRTRQLHARGRTITRSVWRCTRPLWGLAHEL